MWKPLHVPAGKTVHTDFLNCQFLSMVLSGWLINILKLKIWIEFNSKLTILLFYSYFWKVYKIFAGVYISNLSINLGVNWYLPFFLIHCISWVFNIFWWSLKLVAIIEIIFKKILKFHEYNTFTCHCIYIYIYIYIYICVYLSVRLWPGRSGFIPKTQKMAADAS